MWLKLIKESRSFFETQKIELKLNKLNNLIEDPKFWDDRKKAEKILKELAGKQEVTTHQSGLQEVI